MAGATSGRLTNGIPDKIKFALDQTLVKTINDHDEKLRKMFPKLTKEKLAALVSRLSYFPRTSEKIFLNLFADHVSELGKASDALMKMQQTEPDVATAGGKLGDVQTNSPYLTILKSQKAILAHNKIIHQKKPRMILKLEKTNFYKAPKKSASKEQTVENK